MTTETTEIITFADAEQVLADRLPNYQSRPQQQRLASFIEQGILEGGQRLAEAGTGVGKSFAGLIPAILSGQRVIVSTGTKALQDQLAGKDLPFLESHLPISFTWALLKGRSNYACVAKMATAQVLGMEAIRKELADNPEHSGDQESFATPIDSSDWRNLSSTSDECPGKRDCPFADQCYAEKAKKKALESQVVVINTAMLMTDLKIREKTNHEVALLGPIDYLIIDEAHELESIATSQLEETFRKGGLTRLVSEVVNFLSFQRTTCENERPTLDSVENFWYILPQPKDKQRLTQSFFVSHGEACIELIENLKKLSEEVFAVTIQNDQKRETAKRNMLISRLRSAINKIESLILHDDMQSVRWVEVEEKRFRGVTEKQVVLHIAPIHVGEFLKTHLWDEIPATLMSATISVGGNFNYIKGRLGLEDAPTMTAGTPFDYPTQSMLFLPPPTAPSPKDGSGWAGYTTMTIEALLKASGGGALLLFTSRTSMMNSYNMLKDRIEDMGLTVMIQGQGTNKELAQQFKDDTHSVLFALKSFFVGVDFQGDACRLVVIDKLPFAVPTDPIFQARSDEVKRRGGSDFSDLSIPEMTLTLVQGFGRLIRTREDKGVVAILDSRLTTTSWGRRIAGNLPDAKRTTSVRDVEEFYESWR